MKKGTTVSASYLFVLGLIFRNVEEDRECAFGGILRIDPSQAFCGRDVSASDRQGTGTFRKFVKKAISHAIPPGYRLSEPKPRPVLNPLRPRVLSLLQVGSSAQHAPRREVHVWPLKL